MERDFVWLLARADEQAVGVAKLFAHIGLKAIDDFAGERHGQAYVDYKARAISLPESETQVQMLLTRYCLATRLNCLARYLPSAISQPALSIVDDLLVAAVAGCAGEASPTNLTVATQGPRSPRPALWWRPSRCGDDSAGTAHQLGSGS